ncbi:RelA/SpoT family protein [Odoribacter lunatus]|uniref:RelA/SpoT family protein n=1 Tax=Odoribacter lunatus TaxID=2941335 RepID=UPI00203C2ABA|nr:HD domain-containing protein [Odoribacter lunatus]
MQTQEDFDRILEERRALLMEKAAAGRSEEELSRIREAYEFARKAHEGQYRKSGHPYIIHPVSVATIVADELKLGTNPIIAALLHDVVEDTDYTIEEVRDRFGEDVAFLVRVVTKQKKTVYEMSKQLDNFKQMLDSINYDIRALLIKLADRLHNMRTLDSMRPEKQMKIAGETDYFYAPLANRLGLYRVKTELENLSLRFRTPLEYAELEGQIAAFEEENRETMEQFLRQVRGRLEENGIKARVTCKNRGVCAIWRKMQLSGLAFRQVEPLQIVSIVFENNPDRLISEKNQCLEIYSVLTDLYKEKPGSLVNYVDSPKENGYQAIHCKVMCTNGRWLEVHVASERMEYNSALGCVAAGKGVEHWVENFKAVLHDIADCSKEDGFIENVVCNFYNDDITVFTPKGHSVVLPKGATVVDMAYEIHTDIGNHAKYARINGLLAPLCTVLKRGDRVAIGTEREACPQREWLEFVKTYKARKAVTNYLRKIGAERRGSVYRLCPECRPLPGDEVSGFKNENGTITVHKRNCPTAISLSAKAGDSIVPVSLQVDRGKRFPVSIRVRGVDRDKLLFDLVKVISVDLDLPIDGLEITVKDCIADCIFGFEVCSVEDLTAVMTCISQVKGVEEVKRKS